ncbi:DUF6263 family protein [Carboxylicivirga sp. M1479]|uniref:DUF6263 family protein n=1 Tax=Carboxylicivirga sp. M1479 TaxID=2594476 RepID=UPI0011784CFF|nr:DUF6263 family protein [Carboxylicivirga sp. M1479]TRX63270.1 hypothetical protein FNN09_18645 [Carboxylicivirga sp. M1479]
MKRLNQALLIVAVILLSLNVSAQTSLRYKLKVGETYRLKQMTTQGIEQNISGMTQTIKNTFGSDITVAIKGKTGNVYSADMKFESMVFKMESAMMNMSYDSNDASADATNPLNKSFDLMVGHTFQLKFDDRGNIEEVKGFEEVAQKLVTVFGDNPQQAEMMKSTLSGQFSDDNMKHTLANMFIVYPEDKVKVGTKWTTKTKLMQPITINNTFNYNVDVVSKEAVKLSGSGTMATEEGLSKEQMGMVQHFDLNGELSFTADINVKTGWPNEIKMLQKLDGNVAIESPQLPAPMEMPMKITSESTYTSM